MGYFVPTAERSVMTDIHCHILPHTDDGAQSIADAVEMARAAWASGVTAIAATPHFFGDDASVRLIPTIRRRTAQLRAVLKEAKIPIEIFDGAEVLCTEKTRAPAQNRALPTLGTGRYVLCEFYFDEDIRRIAKILDTIAQAGYLPVLAHPERYDAFYKDPGVAGFFFEAGFALQLNRGSILGRFGDNARHTARYLLSHGLCHAVASDAHSPRRRTTHMADVYESVTEYCGRRVADALFSENPSRILNGKRLLTPNEL